MVKKNRGPLIAVVAVLVLLLVYLLPGEESSSKPRDPMTGKTEFDIPVQDSTLVAEGEALYQASCSVCHGSDLRGTALGPSQLSVIYNPDHHGDGSYAVAVTAGVRAHHWSFGNMPSVDGVTEDDFDRILAFIRENQRVQGFEAYPPP